MTSDGAGAAILAFEDFVKKHNLQKQAVEIVGMAMTSDFSSTFDAKSCIKLTGQDMTRAAAEKVYAQAGLGPEAVQVIALHDCFSTIGAPGLAQCAELNWQLRGMADKRQVPGAKVALQHNLGLGGAAVVTMYRKPDPA